MAKIILQHPENLLGRHVYGVQLIGGHRYPFRGIVECVVLPAQPYDKKHGVEFFVGDEYVSVSDCLELEYCE